MTFGLKNRCFLQRAMNQRYILSFFCPYSEDFRIIRVIDCRASTDPSGLPSMSVVQTWNEDTCWTQIQSSAFQNPKMPSLDHRDQYWTSRQFKTEDIPLAPSATHSCTKSHGPYPCFEAGGHVTHSPLRQPMNTEGNERIRLHLFFTFLVANVQAMCLVTPIRSRASAEHLRSQASRLIALFAVPKAVFRRRWLLQLLPIQRLFPQPGQLSGLRSGHLALRRARGNPARLPQRRAFERRPACHCVSVQCDEHRVGQLFRRNAGHACGFVVPYRAQLPTDRACGSANGVGELLHIELQMQRAC